MKNIISILILAIICHLVCEITAARRGYIYKKPNTFQSDVIEEEAGIFDNYFNTTGKVLINRRPARFNRCESCACGRPNDNRIIGGSNVRYNKYPWIAQLLYNTRFYCGGSLINTRYVLTAAHCTTSFRAKDISVRLLQFDRNAPAHGITRKITKVTAHPQYSTRTLDNDIALLQMDQSIPLKSTLRPICLPNVEQNFDNFDGIAAGWGLTKESGKVSTILQEVVVPIITNYECRKTKYKAMITVNMLCAGNVKIGGADACQGDSGGPLISSSEGTFKLAGVVSYGYGCAQPNAPGVYARVAKYLSWIRENTQDSCYCNQ